MELDYPLWHINDTHYLLLAESLGTSPQLNQGKKRPRSGSETETQSAAEALNDASNDDNEDDDTPGMTMTLSKGHPRFAMKLFLTICKTCSIYELLKK